MEPIATHPPETFREVTPRGSPFLRELERSSMDAGIPIVGPHIGAFLYLLVRAIRPRRILELGTANGYSTIWMAMALEDAGPAGEMKAVLPGDGPTARKGPGVVVGQGAGQGNGQMARGGTGADMVEGNGQHAGQGTGDGTGQGTRQDAGQGTAQGSGQGNGQMTQGGAGQDTGQGTGQGAAGGDGPSTASQDPDIGNPAPSILSIEWDPDMAAQAALNIGKAGYEQRVELRVADARQAVTTLAAGSYDLVFVDVEKEHYSELLDPVITLLRPGGLLFFDNTAFVSAGDFLRRAAAHHGILPFHFYGFMPFHGPEWDAVTLAVKR